MRISSVTSTDLFAGTVAHPLQVIRVTLANAGAGLIRASGTPVTVRVEGPGVSTPRPVSVPVPEPGGERTAEVGVAVAAPHVPGAILRVTAIAETGRARPAPARSRPAPSCPRRSPWPRPAGPCGW